MGGELDMEKMPSASEESLVRMGAGHADLYDALRPSTTVASGCFEAELHMTQELSLTCGVHITLPVHPDSVQCSLLS